MGRRPGVPTVYLPDGKTIHMCAFTAHGVRHRVSTGERDHGRALEAATKLQAEALLRRPVKRRRRASHSDQASLELLSGLYLENVEASGCARSYYVKQVMHFRAHFLPRWARLSDLTTEAIERYASERSHELTQTKKAPSTVTIYKEMVTLSRFLRWAKRAGHLDTIPDFDRVRRVSDHKTPDLTADDVRAVLAQLPTRHTHPRRYAVRERYTVQWAQGMRDGEIATLRWSDVDLAGGRVTVRQGNDKARQGRTVELAAAARAVLEELAKDTPVPTALVFGRADLRAALTAACTKAGRPRITTHVFRHARLSELAAATHDTAAIQYLAGHKSLATTDRYVRSRTERTGKVFDAADSVTSKPVGDRKRSSSARRQRG